MRSEKYISKSRVPFFLLGSRLAMFLIFQAVIALLTGSWKLSERYWLLSATLTNIVSIVLLWILFRKEGLRFINIFRFERSTLKRDLLLFLGLTLIAGPVVFAPGYLLSNMIWNDPEVPTALMFGSIEPWVAYLLLLAFPVTIAMAELATYFVYIMPRLKHQVKPRWLALLLPVLFLSLQHCTLPFIPDVDFIVYRALVFLPFAALIGASLWFRPTLFPWFAILHGIMDFATALMFIIY
ncbi:MAG: hypothetical protein IH591_04840 [Bacteroidales bacterium]|nr:hypothetical protein [Bacteroidales bacterium]